jgi:hypothetical protein
LCTSCPVRLHNKLGKIIGSTIPAIVLGSSTSNLQQLLVSPILQLTKDQTCNQHAELAAPMDTGNVKSLQ